MATYGEGDPTDNAQDFYDWLQENDDEDLSGLNYTVSVRPRSVSYSTQEEQKQKALVLYLSVSTFSVMAVMAVLPGDKNAAVILKIL